MSLVFTPKSPNLFFAVKVQALNYLNYIYGVFRMINNKKVSKILIALLLGCMVSLALANSSFAAPTNVFMTGYWYNSDTKSFTDEVKYLSAQNKKLGAPSKRVTIIISLDSINPSTVSALTPSKLRTVFAFANIARANNVEPVFRLTNWPKTNTGEEKFEDYFDAFQAAAKHESFDLTTNNYGFDLDYEGDDLVGDTKVAVDLQNLKASAKTKLDYISAAIEPSDAGNISSMFADSSYKDSVDQFSIMFYDQGVNHLAGLSMIKNALSEIQTTLSKHKSQASVVAILPSYEEIPNGDIQDNSGNKFATWSDLFHDFFFDKLDPTTNPSTYYPLLPQYNVDSYELDSTDGSMYHISVSKAAASKIANASTIVSSNANFYFVSPEYYEDAAGLVIAQSKKDVTRDYGISFWTLERDNDPQTLLQQNLNPSSKVKAVNYSNLPPAVVSFQRAVADVLYSAINNGSGNNINVVAPAFNKATDTLAFSADYAGGLQLVPYLAVVKTDLPPVAPNKTALQDNWTCTASLKANKSRTLSCSAKLKPTSVQLAQKFLSIEQANIAADNWVYSDKTELALSSHVVSGVQPDQAFASLPSLSSMRRACVLPSVATITLQDMDKHPQQTITVVDYIDAGSEEDFTNSPIYSGDNYHVHIDGWLYGCSQSAPSQTGTELDYQLSGAEILKSGITVSFKPFQNIK